MAKVILIYPPMTFGKRRGFGFPPLGILYVAASLKKEGIDVKVVDSFMEGHTLDELKELIIDEKPDIVGFSAMSCQAISVLAIAGKLKKELPSIKIAVGGPHISSTKDELFKFSNDIDFLFYGAGEEVFPEFVKALRNGQALNEINGLIYKNGSGVKINNPLEAIKDLDDLAFPDFGMVDINSYDSYYARSLPLASLMASRGCPFRCTFCDAYATHGRFLRYRSPENIVDEIEYNYKKYRIRQIMFKDSTFTVNSGWVIEICREIKKRHLKIEWSCNTRVDLVDNKILKAMRNSGCYMIMFGIESGSQRILDALRKGITVEQIKRGVSLCKKNNILTMGYFIVGSPGEDENDACKTIKLSKAIGLNFATFGVTTAYPGTEFYSWGIANNALTDRFWYMAAEENVFDSIRETRGNLNLVDFPPDRQAQVAKEANKAFYFRPSIIFQNIFRMRKIKDMRRLVKAFKELRQG